MKKIILSLIVVVLAFANTMGQQSSLKSDNNPATVYSTPMSVKGPAGACIFLVFRDNLPWGSAAVTNILTANGETFTVLGSASMATEDFSLYDVIIIESDQIAAFYVNFTAQFPKFVAFVTNGGRLEVHAATCGHNSPCGTSVQLPGGVYTVENHLATADHYNNVVDFAHPIVAGVSNPFYGNYASHGWFANLVAGTDIITETQSYGNQPTTIQYSYGSGTVTATMCTYEYGYMEGEEAGEMLVNNLNYSCEYVPPIPVSPWAIGLGIFLILVFTVYRIRKN